MDMFTWEPGKARLDKQGKVNAWTAGRSDQSQWLQVRSYGWLQGRSYGWLHVRSYGWLHVRSYGWLQVRRYE